MGSVPGASSASDGVIPLTGALMPEIAAKLQRTIDAHLSPRTAPMFAPESRDSADSNTPELADNQTATEETRTLDQQRHDILAGMVDLALRSSDTPMLGGAAPTVLVSVNATDLAHSLATGSTGGVGFIDGLDVPVSMRAVKQFACNGGIQPIVFGPAGDIQQLGSPHRCFTPQQRRAILLRDGGCAITGCSAPGAWCEIHHVLPHVRVENPHDQWVTTPQMSAVDRHVCNVEAGGAITNSGAEFYSQATSQTEPNGCAGLW